MNFVCKMGAGVSFRQVGLTNRQDIWDFVDNQHYKLLSSLRKTTPTQVFHRNLGVVQSMYTSQTSSIDYRLCRVATSTVMQLHIDNKNSALEVESNQDQDPQ